MKVDKAAPFAAFMEPSLDKADLPRPPAEDFSDGESTGVDTAALCAAGVMDVLGATALEITWLLM